MGEVYYITLREQGQDLADLAYSRIKALPIKLIDRIDEELLLKAAGLKARYPISYADSFAAALAMIKNSPLLTGDPEFRPVVPETKDGLNLAIGEAHRRCTRQINFREGWPVCPMGKGTGLAEY